MNVSNKVLVLINIQGGNIEVVEDAIMCMDTHFCNVLSTLNFTSLFNCNCIRCERLTIRAMYL